uniref:SEA domain-containing protein n=1 Tax=Hanusia phi TaxID=3032 RepID=A0A7S0HXS8_9CRYP
MTTSNIPKAGSSNDNGLEGTTATVDLAMEHNQASSSIISTTPVNHQSQAYLYMVKLSVTLPLSPQQFGPSERKSFIDAVARTAKVQPSQVSITNVISSRRGGFRRLLAANSITIECTIGATEPNAVKRIMQNVTMSVLNQELAQGGLPASSSVSVISADSSNSNGSSDTYLLIGCCIGSAFSLILFYFIARQVRGCRKARENTFTYLSTSDPPPTAPPMPFGSESTANSIEEEEIPPPPPLASNSQLCFVQNGKEKFTFDAC